MKQVSKHLLPCIFCILIMNKVNTQNLAGVYNLVGVMETAAGFKLNEDSTFEFYFFL